VKCPLLLLAPFARGRAPLFPAGRCNRIGPHSSTCPRARAGVASFVRRGLFAPRSVADEKRRQPHLLLLLLLVVVVVQLLHIMATILLLQIIMTHDVYLSNPGIHPCHRTILPPRIDTKVCCMYRHRTPPRHSLSHPPPRHRCANCSM